MVSVELIITLTKRPIKESGPKVLYKSKSMPVEADEEIKRINVRGTVSFGYPIASASGETHFSRRERAPEALSIPTDRKSVV